MREIVLILSLFFSSHKTFIFGTSFYMIRTLENNFEHLLKVYIQKSNNRIAKTFCKKNCKIAKNFAKVRLPVGLRNTIYETSVSMQFVFMI